MIEKLNEARESVKILQVSLDEKKKGLEEQNAKAEKKIKTNKGWGSEDHTSELQ